MRFPWKCMMWLVSSYSCYALLLNKMTNLVDLDPYYLLFHRLKVTFVYLYHSTENFQFFKVIARHDLYLRTTSNRTEPRWTEVHFCCSIQIYNLISVVILHLPTRGIGKETKKVFFIKKIVYQHNFYEYIYLGKISQNAVVLLLKKDCLNCGLYINLTWWIRLYLTYFMSLFFWALLHNSLIIIIIMIFKKKF